MDKKLLVSALIANALLSFTEDDRETLMALDDAVLEKMKPAETPVENAVQKAAERGFNGPAPVANTAPVVPATTEEYIAAAPPAIRQLLQNSLATHEAEKNKLIAEITANKSNTFTPEFLSMKDIPELKGIAALANNGKAAEGGVPMFIGQSFGVPGSIVDNAVDDDEPLSLPSMAV